MSDQWTTESVNLGSSQTMKQRIMWWVGEAMHQRTSESIERMRQMNQWTNNDSVNEWGSEHMKYSMNQWVNQCTSELVGR